ncbi:MAG: hypothetical protein FJY85_20615, partial [Deltaproteobacteria bacterium]|nr:hypothetical protein [Deltaproteobacteria bacterium]
MFLENITLSLPIFKFKSRVSHCTPRRPTVFERTILRIVQRLSANPRWSAAPVIGLFEEVLLVADSDKLVLSALEELQSLGVLQYAGEFSSISRARLCDLSITDHGMNMFRDGMLPGKTVDTMVDHLFDPVAQKLLRNSQESLYLREPLPAAIKPDLVGGDYPKPQIEADLSNGTWEWLNNQSRVVEVKLASRTILWKTTKAQLTVSPAAEINLAVSDSSHQDFLMQLDAEVLLEGIIRPGLNGAVREDLMDDIPRVDFASIAAQGADFFSLVRLSDRIRLRHGEAHFLSNGHPGVWEDLSNTVKNLKSGLVVVYNNP